MSYNASKWIMTTPMNRAVILKQEVEKTLSLGPQPSGLGLLPK